MTTVQIIAEKADLTTSGGCKLAAQKMKSVSDFELHLYLVMRDTLQATSHETRKSIALAQVESDRRSTSEARRLAFFTTVGSGLVGLLGVALGALLTH
jgi:hypothetical protein